MVTAYSTRTQATVKTLLVIVTVLDTTLQVATWSPIYKPDSAVTDPSCNTELENHPLHYLSLTCLSAHVSREVGRRHETGDIQHKDVGLLNTGKRKKKCFLIKVTFPRCVAHVHHVCAQLW